MFTAQMFSLQTTEKNCHAPTPFQKRCLLQALNDKCLWLLALAVIEIQSDGEEIPDVWDFFADFVAVPWS